MAQFKYSVVIPLYNKRGTIRRAVESVIRQTFTNFEIVVVDDGSTDDSAIEAAKVGDPRLTVIRQENCGASSARNAGLAAARADFVCFLDADDFWDPEFLEIIDRLVTKDSSAGLYAARYGAILPDGSMRSRPVALDDSHFGEVPEFYRTYAHSRSLICSSNVCVSREALSDIGGFPPAAKTGEDVYVWLLLGLKLRLMYTARELVTIDMSAANRTVDRVQPELPYFLKHFLLGEGRAVFRCHNGIQYYIKHSAIRYCGGLLSQGARFEVLKFARSCMFETPQIAFVLLTMCLVPKRVYCWLREWSASPYARTGRRI